MSATSTTASGSQSGAPLDPTRLVEEVRSKYAKLKGMQELDAQGIFSRDSKRLDAKARATYRKLGLSIGDAPGDLQMIADNVTLDAAARADILKRLDDDEMGDVRIVADNITFAGGAAPAPAPATPAPAPGGGANVPAPAEKSSTLSPLAAAAAIGAALLGGGGIGIAAMNLFSRQEPAAVQPGTDTDTDTNAGLRFGPDE